MLSNSVTACDSELLPCPDSCRIRVDGVGGAPATADCRQEVAVDCLDGIYTIPKRNQAELLPAQQLRRIRMHDVGGEPTAAHCGQIEASRRSDAIMNVWASIPRVDQRELLPRSDLRLIRADHVSDPPATAYRREVVPVAGLEGTASDRCIDGCRKGPDLALHHSALGWRGGARRRHAG